MTWDWEFAQSILPALLEGLKLTIYATLAASGLSIALGLVWALGRRSRLRVAQVAISWFTEFIRRTPVLIQLYFIFLILPSMGITLSPMAAGIIGLGLNYSTYTMEIYRAGIDSIHKGQWEAAHVLSLPKAATWFRVILPQAVPRVVPALGNTVISMFKDTALLSVITVQEVMAVAQGTGARTYTYTEPLLLAAAMYLVLGYGSSLVVRCLERRLAIARPSTAKAS
jgi:polar amino acid transport system permease protein